MRLDDPIKNRQSLRRSLVLEAPGSRTAILDQRFQRNLSETNALAQALDLFRGAARPGAEVGRANLQDQSRYGLAVASDDNLFSLLHPIPQGAERIFSLEGANLAHIHLE
jgi:hypothetical protein